MMNRRMTELNRRLQAEELQMSHHTHDKHSFAQAPQDEEDADTFLSMQRNRLSQNLMPPSEYRPSLRS